MPLPLAAAVLLLPAAAGAASFPCAKASTATEKAICADPAVSKLDERAAAAYGKARELLSGASPEDSDVLRAVKADQKAWLAERDACGADAGCLKAAYERRIAVLGFAPDPKAPSPADRFVGQFHVKELMSIDAMALRDGRVAFSASGAEPSRGSWVCSFTGFGRLDGDGRLVVGTPNAEGEGLIVEADGPRGVRIADNAENQAASSMYCGHNGTFIFRYARQP